MTLIDPRGHEEVERLRSQVATLEQLLQVHEDTALLQAERLEAVIRRLKAKTQEVSELNQTLEERVAERTEELEAAVKEMEAFCYSVSHDLRAPLRTLDGFSQALLEDYADKLDDEGKNYLDRIRVNTQRLGILMDALLQLSRLNRKEMATVDCDLSEMARQAVSDVEKSYPDRNVRVEIAPNIHAEGDASLMQVALWNLVNNAFKFTGKTEQAEITIGTTTHDGELCFFIRDNGVGFDMQYKDKLFGAFQRLHHPKDFDGTGIGLATVQRVMQRHRGQAWAEGQVGKGATFYFKLPGLRVSSLKECA